jgi:2-dehydropantoate 2-reductase
VRSAIDGESVATVTAVADVGGLPPADVVLFCVKSFDTETAAAAIRPAIGPDTAVVSLQNGVDNEETLERVLGPGHAVGGVATCSPPSSPPASSPIASPAISYSASSTAGPARGWRALRAAFEKAGVRAEVAGDIRRALWLKYVMISARPA